MPFQIKGMEKKQKHLKAINSECELRIAKYLALGT